MDREEFARIIRPRCDALDQPPAPTALSPEAEKRQEKAFEGERRALHEIAATPARTIAGLGFKAEVSAVEGHLDPMLVSLDHGRHRGVRNRASDAEDLARRRSIYVCEGCQKTSKTSSDNRIFDGFIGSKDVQAFCQEIIVQRVGLAEIARQSELVSKVDDVVHVSFLAPPAISVAKRQRRSLHKAMALAPHENLSFYRLDLLEQILLSLSDHAFT